MLNGPNMLPSPSNAFRPLPIVSMNILQGGKLNNHPIAAIFQGMEEVATTTITK